MKLKDIKKGLKGLFEKEELENVITELDGQDNKKDNQGNSKGGKFVRRYRGKSNKEHDGLD
jgi:hypothetical protein